MKILMCIAGLSAGGGEGQFLKLAKGLQDAGHDVRIHVFGRRKAVHYHEIEQWNIPLYFSEIQRGEKWRAFFIILRDIKKNVEDFQPQILFGTLFIASCAVRLAKIFRFTKARIVSTIRTDYQKCFSPWYKCVESVLCCVNDALVTNHKPTYEFFRTKIGNRAGYIPNGIPVEKGGAFTDDGVKPSLTVFLSVGRLVMEYKKQDVLLFALADLCKRKPSCLWKCLILGDGKDRDHLEKMIREMNLCDRVEIRKSVENIRPYYHDADALVHNSVLEGCPNAVLEAMCMEKPVIASAYIGKLGIIMDGENGLVARSDDAESLADKLSEFIEMEQGRRIRMGKNARLFVLEHFSEQTMIKAHIKLFEHILKI
ncbi:MAG: glycosyltransferase family 4 protein [Candidatus Aureabacteria bacterium]|nr:glycosyltransferase family 4 protein [Candidatus Auribacterota bacterium]